jgi:hypothetical protein
VAVLISFGHGSRVGKDTCCKILTDHYGFTQVAFADALRDFVLWTHPLVADIVEQHGWEKAKEVEPIVRKTLVEVGNAARETLGRDVWVRAAFERLGERTCISDLRYKNEADATHARGGLCVKVIRPGHDPLPNIADQALVDFEGWDAEILNDGTVEDLHVQLDKLLSQASLKL